ncbi:CPBP family glutamic-type intramembrane protease [Candidatus Lokiarchaeum ossiferum]|uniref:CPBP family glutamic-type intramembrane protease n=1 Tax=Candidatus Lokiarchaeum ossiferum TaxID=2951803 RepID=UPI00352C066F
MENNTSFSNIQEKQFTKKVLLTYFIITFLITWACWITAILFLRANDWPIPSVLTFLERSTSVQSKSQKWLNFIFSLGTFGPLISAIITQVIYYDLAHLKAYFKRFFYFKFELKWYLIIILIPLASSAIGILSALLNPETRPNLFQFNFPWYFPFLLFLNQTFSSGLEEPGWRGLATPEMQKIKSAEDSGYIIGTIWSIWHFPFLIFLYGEMYNWNIFLMIISLVGYIGLTIPMAIITVWLYNNTKSIGALIIFHGLLNTLPQILLGGITDSFSGILIAVGTWIFAAFLSKKYGKQTLVKKEDI